MNSIDLLHIRLYNQLLAGCNFTRPAEIVAWLGAMQSQNYEMAKWGIGIRLPGITNKQVEAATNAGEIIRTHILRPTWHFVAAEDIHWMHELTAPRLIPAYKSYARMRGVKEEFILKGLDVVASILEEHGHLTRQEIAEHLEARGIDTTGTQDAKDVLSRAELEGIICNGEVRGTKQTYALLHERVPKKYTLSKEESVERLARRYFTSHGPATLQDFLWWSNLTLTEIRKAMECIIHDFICETINGKDYWMPNNIQTPPAGMKFRHLLPAFDEFVVSYKDREEMIHEKYYRKVLTINGIFSPTIHYNGYAVGSWRRVNKKGVVVAELDFFPTTPKKVQGMFGKAVKEYNKFNSL